MSEHPGSTPGAPDAALLLTLLRESGATTELAALRSLVAGVLGAAEAADPDGWIALISEHPTPALVAALKSLKASMAAVKPPAPEGAERLAAMRAEMARLGVDAFALPRSDAGNREYLPACSERIAWLSLFTGSMGWAAVTQEAAALFVHPIYLLQAAAQTDEALWTVHSVLDEPADVWLGKTLRPGQVLGYDPWLVNETEALKLEAAAKRAGAACRPLDENPVERVWQGRPALPLGPVIPHPISLSGRSAESKLDEIAAQLRAAGQDVTVITTTESVAWLLNIRGSDVRNTPLTLSSALVHDDGRVDLFIDRRKLTPGLEQHLGTRVSVLPPDGFSKALAALSGKTVRVDPLTAPVAVAHRLKTAGAEIVGAPDPCIVPRGMKNPVELAGARACHRRDGVAMVRFLSWLDHAVTQGPVTEMQASSVLDGFRRQSPGNRGLSFPTISAAGHHAALPHYGATPATDMPIPQDSLYLVDSGGQYEDGTTDITRTVAIGAPDAIRCDRYTRVLKGHIALTRAVFTRGTTGYMLDSIPRQALWAAGADYDHGTGHGVGSYLGVHEGPGRIGPTQPFHAVLPGMVTSIEPGYYREGAFGVRIENLAIVTEVTVPGAERAMLGFEPITCCPIDTRPLIRELLEPAEIEWLNAYHAEVRADLMPWLDDPTEREWLERATRPI